MNKKERNKRIPLSSRRRARECVVQALYSFQLSKNNIFDIEMYFLNDQDMSGVDIDYFREIYVGTVMRIRELDDIIFPYLTRTLQSIGYVELSILRMALFELSKKKDVPYKVIINEAIELAKIFGAEKSHKFINGVLNKLSIKIRHEEMQTN